MIVEQQEIVRRVAGLFALADLLIREKLHLHQVALHCQRTSLLTILRLMRLELLPNKH